METQLRKMIIRAESTIKIKKAAIEAYSIPHWLAFIALCIVSAAAGIFWLFAFGWMCTGYRGAFWSAVRGKALDGGDLF